MKKIIFIALFLVGVLFASSCGIQDPKLSGDCGDCTPWAEDMCGGGDCGEDDMRYERACTGDIFSDVRPSRYDNNEIPLSPENPQYSLGDVPQGCIEKCVYDPVCGADYDCVSSYSLREGETVYIGSNTVYVDGIFDDMVLLNINGNTELMNKYESIFVQNVFVNVYAVGYNPDEPENSATILVIAANEGDYGCVNSYSLREEETVYMGSHLLNVGTIFEDRVEIWIDNGNHEFMQEEEIGFFLDSVFVYVEDILYAEDVQDRRVLLKAAGGDNPQQLTEYPYRVEIIEDYEIYDGQGNSIERDVLMFTAIGWESQDKGFEVGSVETGKVVVVTPTEVRGLWGPIYYEDSNGILQEYAGMNFEIIPATGNGESAQVWYNPFEGQINIGSEDLMSGHLVLLRWMPTGKCDVSAFDYFGYYPETAEGDELFIWNMEGEYDCGEGGYYGECEEEIQVGDYMVIHEPDLYLENEEFTFSFYL